MGAIQSMIVGKLNTVLGEYFEGIDTSQIDTSIRKGTLELSNLTARRDAFAQFGLPIGVLKGRLGYMKLTIPWRNLRTKAVKVDVTDLYLLCRKEEWSNNGQVERELAQKIRNLNGTTEKLKFKLSTIDKDVKDQSDDEGFSDRLIQTVLDNLEITVTNVHIRFEDDTLLSVDGAPPSTFNLGLHMKKIVGYTCDEQGNKSFNSDPNQVIKKLSLEGLGIYCNAQSDEAAEWSSAGSTMEEFEEKMTQSIMPNDTIPPHNYVLAPAFFGLTWRQQRANAAAGQPRHHVVVHLVPQQLWAVLCMLEYQKYFERWDQYRGGSHCISNARSGESFNAKRMWLHAGEAIRGHITKQSAPLNHEAMVRRNHTRTKYQWLFRSHIYSNEKEDGTPKEMQLLPWQTTKITKQQKAEFKSLRKQLSLAELQSYEASELLKIFAEKNKYWVQWHAANDDLSFYQSEVVIKGVTLTAEEAEEVRIQCGGVLSESDDNTFYLFAELSSPGLEMLVSNSEGLRVACAKCQEINVSFRMAAEMQVQLGCKNIGLEDCITQNSKFPYIVGSAGDADSPWCITYSSAGGHAFQEAAVGVAPVGAVSTAPKLELSCKQQLQIVLVPSWIEQVSAVFTDTSKINLQLSSQFLASKVSEYRAHSATQLALMRKERTQLNLVASLHAPCIVLPAAADDDDSPLMSLDLGQLELSTDQRDSAAAGDDSVAYEANTLQVHGSLCT